MQAFGGTPDGPKYTRLTLSSGFGSIIIKAIGASLLVEF
jgi:hypothetical protein